MAIIISDYQFKKTGINYFPGLQNVDFRFFSDAQNIAFDIQRLIPKKRAAPMQLGLTNLTAMQQARTQ